MPSPNVDRHKKLLVTAAAGVTALLSMRALLKPRHDDPDTRLFDWDAIAHHASERSKESGRSFASTKLDEACDADAHAVAPWLAEVCNDAPIAFPNFRAIDRRGFVDVNVRIIQRMTKPVEDLRATVGQSRMTSIGRSVSSRYVGELLGLMSRRVLGQYDPVLSLEKSREDETALYVVQPNIAGYAKKYGVNEGSLRRWIIMHELTHAWQFEQHPWLHEYLQETLHDLLMSDVLAEVTEDSRARRTSNVTRHLPIAIRKQIAGVSKVQAVMSLLEGYSNYVMNQVGAVHLADFTELEKSFHQRRTEKSLVERLILAVTGINMKLRQYEIGERFCRQVVTASNIDRLNLVWSNAASIPTMKELQQPKLWLGRIS